jgi:cardiolipin synthase
MVLRAFDGAREKIHITHAYFIPDPRLSRALERAVARGVDVHLIVPANSDVALALAAGRAAQPALLEQGVRISRRLGRVLHSKTIVVDDRWSSLGSSNLNYRSFHLNQEVNVEIPDEGFARRIENLFQVDLLQSVSVTLEDLQSRPLPRRVLDFLAFQLRYWL